jgi:hypothetical protein
MIIDIKLGDLFNIHLDFDTNDKNAFQLAAAIVQSFSNAEIIEED